MKNKIKKFIVNHSLLGKNQWQKFESGGYFYYSGQRVTFTKALDFVKKPGNALDIGAGYGNEVKALLRRGFTVDATDINQDAVKYLHKVALRKSALKVYPIGLPELPESTYDFIVCEMVLHFLNKKDAYSAIAKMQQATNKSGLHVISSYIDTSGIHSDPRIKPGYFTFLLKEGELKELYKDWKILYYEEKSNVLGFKSARMIARKDKEANKK